MHFLYVNLADKSSRLFPSSDQGVTPLLRTFYWVGILKQKEVLTKRRL